MGVGDGKTCSVPISSDQISNRLASSTLVVAAKLLSFPHRSW